MAKQREPLTDVIFRRYREGDILAIMPGIPGTYDPTTCQSYQHVGQHGACDPHGVIRFTYPAKPYEYRDLMAELKQIGYRVRVVTRHNRRYQRIRENELKQAERD